MVKYSDYIVIHGERSYVITTVNRYLEQGYTFIGGINYSDGYYTQAMALEPKKEVVVKSFFKDGTSVIENKE